MPVFWWVGLDLVFLVSKAASGGVFWGVWVLSMVLGILSANGCGCVPVCYFSGMGRPALEPAGRWVELGLSVETEISGTAPAG